MTDASSDSEPPSIGLVVEFVACLWGVCIRKLPCFEGPIFSGARGWTERLIGPLETSMAGRGTPLTFIPLPATRSA
jgi:hypothetical protein